FGALLLPNKKADLPFDKRPAGGTQYQCRISSGSTNCGGTLDPWSAAIPHGSCCQGGSQRPPCTFDGCAADDGRNANWRPRPDHAYSHFNGLIPPANARDIIGRTNSNLSYQYTPTYWSVESRRSEAMGGGTPTIAAMANAYSVLGLTQYIGRKKV